MIFYKVDHVVFRSGSLKFSPFVCPNLWCYSPGCFVGVLPIIYSSVFLTVSQMFFLDS